MQQVTDNVLKGVSLYTYLVSTVHQGRHAISNFTDTGELMWDLFSKNQQDINTLPPTPDALKFHVQRSNYVCDWKENDGRLVATMTDQLPAPEYSIEMSSCTCQKTHLREVFVLGQWPDQHRFGQCGDYHNM